MDLGFGLGDCRGCIGIEIGGSNDELKEQPRRTNPRYAIYKN